MFKNGNVYNKVHSGNALPKSISFDQIIGSKGSQLKHSIFINKDKRLQEIPKITTNNSMIKHYKEENILEDKSSFIKGFLRKLNTGFFEDSFQSHSSQNEVFSPKKIKKNSIYKKENRGSVPLNVMYKRPLPHEAYINSPECSNRDTGRSFKHSVRSSERSIKIHDNNSYKRSSQTNTSHLINKFIQNNVEPNRVSMISILEEEKLAGNLKDIIRTKKLRVDDPKNGNLNVTSNISKLMEDESLFIQSFRDRSIMKKGKVYDSMSLEEEEFFKLTGFRKFIIEPDSKTKYYWDMYITILTFTSVISVSYLLAFPNMTSDLSFFINCLTDFSFILDLILNFFVGFYDSEENIIRSYQSIAGNYLTNWFFYDFFGSIPTNTILDLVNYDVQTHYIKTNKLSGARIFRLFKFLKYMFQNTKHGELEKILEKLNIQISSYNQRLLSFLFYFIIISHNIACLWIYVGFISYPNWITQYNFIGISPTELYIASLYFNLTTIYTIGYGDICSVNIYERIYNVILMIVGVFLYSYAVTSLSNMFTSHDDRTKKYIQNKSYLDEMNSLYDIPENLLIKINKFLKFNLRSSNKEEKNDLILELPYSVKQNMICEIYKDIIENFKFFKYIGNNRDFNCRVALALRHVKVYKDDIILARNEFVNELIFVKNGTLSLDLEYLGEKVKIVEIHKNEHFGDVLMFLNEKSPINLKVSSKSAELYLMKKIELIKIFSEFSDIYNDIYDASLFNYLKIKNVVKYHKRKIRLLYNSKLTEMKKKKLFKSKSSKGTIKPRIEEEEKSNLEKTSFMSLNSLHVKEARIILNKMSSVKNIQDSSISSPEKINEVEDVIKESLKSSSSRSNSLNLKRESSSDKMYHGMKRVFENLEISKFHFNIIGKLSKDKLTINERSCIKRRSSSVSREGKKQKNKSKNFSINYNIGVNNNLMMKNRVGEDGMDQKKIFVEKINDKEKDKEYKKYVNIINDSHSNDNSVSPERKHFDRDSKINYDKSSNNGKNIKNSTVNLKKGILDSFNVANNLKKNIADISLNYNDPKNFYSNYLSNIKKEKEFEEISTKINKKLDDLISLFNVKPN